MEENSSYLQVTALPNTTENFTLPSNGSADVSRYPGDLLDAAAACFILFSIIGVSGNLISILALAKCPRLRNATTAFIINLCVADLIFCSFSSPLQAVTYIERAWNYGDGILCKLFPFISYTNAMVSLFTVVAITINRYVCIVHPLSYASAYRRRNVGIMILILWISVLGLMSLPLFEVWGKLGYDTEGRSCDIIVLKGNSPKNIFFSIALGLPTVIFVFCYSRIYWVVRKASRKVQNIGATGTPSQARSAKVPALSEVREAIQKPHFWVYLKNSDQVIEVPKVRKERKELKVLKVTLIIFVTYVLCFFPVSLVKVLRKEDDVPILNVLGYLLAYLANCMNPIIYVAFSDEYRQAYFHLFACRKSGPKIQELKEF